MATGEGQVIRMGRERTSVRLRLLQPDDSLANIVEEPGCGATVYRKQVEDNLYVCPECDHHFYVSAANRIAQLLD